VRPLLISGLGNLRLRISLQPLLFPTSLNFTPDGIKRWINKHEGSSSRYTTTVDPCGSRLLALRGRADGPDKATARQLSLLSKGITGMLLRDGFISMMGHNARFKIKQKDAEYVQLIWILFDSIRCIESKNR